MVAFLAFGLAVRRQVRGVLVGAAAALLFATSAIAAPPKPGGLVDIPADATVTAVPTVDSQGVAVDGGWLRVHWSASCPPPPGAAVESDNWYVGFGVTDQFGQTPATSGTSGGGSKNITGEASASGTFESFVFMKPGLESETYHVRVTIDCFVATGTDSYGNAAGTNETITIGGASFTLFRGTAPASLVVGVTSSAPNGKVPVGGTATVTAKVTAQGGALDRLGVALGVNGAELKVTSSPPGLIGFSLAKGASRSFVFKVKGLSDGLVTVSAEAHGTAAAGTLVHASDSTKLRIGKSVSVQVAFAAGALSRGLAVGKTVDVPVDVTAGNVDLTSVSLGGGLVASNTKVKVTQAAGLSGFSLAAGATRTFVFKVEGVIGGDSSLTAKVTAASAEGNVSSSATLAVKGLLTIQGTVNVVSACGSATCPLKPVIGVTVAALSPAGGGQAMTGPDGTYSIDLPKGTYTVSPSFPKFVFGPATRSVTLGLSNRGSVDFRACRPGVLVGGTPAPCTGPEIQVTSVKVTGAKIELHYRGTDWDPNGGPISLSLSGNPAAQGPAQASFNGVLTIDGWPKRTSVPIAQARQNANGYCWGELAARQGGSFVSSGIVTGKLAGWILWSGDPRVRAQEAWCVGEDRTLFHTSPYPVILYDIETGIWGDNLDFPGSRSGLNPFAPVIDVSFEAHRGNVCIRLHATSGILTISTSPGPCAKP